jgi:hypothetical protein
MLLSGVRMSTVVGISMSRDSIPVRSLTKHSPPMQVVVYQTSTLVHQLSERQLGSAAIARNQVMIYNIFHVLRTQPNDGHMCGHDCKNTTCLAIRFCAGIIYNISQYHSGLEAINNNNGIYVLLDLIRFVVLFQYLLFVL